MTAPDELPAAENTDEPFVEAAENRVPERVVGASTADQVFGRWQEFLAESQELLRPPGRPSSWRQMCPRNSPASWVETEEADALQATALRIDSAVGRAVAALTAAMQEARLCISTAPQIFRQLAIFGESLGDSAEEDSLQTPPQLFVEMSQLLPTLRNLRQLLSRIETVAEHLVRQVAATYATSLAAQAGQPLHGLAKQPLRPALDVLGELLALPVIVDGLIVENSCLKRAYDSYSWVVSKAQGSGAPGAAGASQIPELPSQAAATLVHELQQAQFLLRGEAFQVCLEHVVHALSNTGEGEASPSSLLKDQLAGYFRARLEESDPASTSAKQQLFLPPESMVHWVCSFVLFSRVFIRHSQRSDARFVLDVWKLHKKSPAVVLHGRVVWCLGDFLTSYVPELMADPSLQKELRELTDLRLKQATRLDEGSFSQEMQNCRIGVMAWLARLQTVAGTSYAAEQTHALLLQGLTLAARVRTSLEEYLVLHYCEKVGVPKPCVASVSLGFELLKAIEAAPSAACWAELSVLMQRNLALRMQRELQESSAKLSLQRSVSAEAALHVAEAALQRLLGMSASAKQVDTLFDTGALALAFCSAGRSDLASEGIGGRWRELQVASCWRRHLAKLCDTSWCYWVREFLPELLSDLRLKESSIPGLPLLFGAFASPLDNLVPEGTPEGQAYLDELRSALEVGLIQPICASIEKDLRLHTHAIMQGCREVLPQAPAAEALAFLQLRPLGLTKRSIVDIKDQVENRLSRHFYDLAALAPQDAEAYLRMRCLAKERYGLLILDGNLPSGSLQQGLDVIDIMRNVQQLATQYGYSLHQQFFSQVSNQGDAKIRTITVEHLAASIRVHGIGVVNTAVNYTVGFLKRKLEVVAEFLSDEYVKSRLLADQKWMEGRPCYTWAQALETTKFLRRLGAGKDGVPFFDKLRQFLTQIGNSLGYVRMVRTAGMRSMASGLEYLEACPWLGEEHSMAGKGELLEAIEAAECGASVKEAAALAETVARKVLRCFDASTDHLNLLASVFSKALAARRQTGVGFPATRLFHLLVPAAACSFLDSLLVGRETLAKRAVAPTSGPRGDLLLFDDGFAVGVAFVLRVFGLEREFHALHWFQTEIADSDVAVGQARVAAGVPLQEPGAQQAADRRSQLEKELGRLAATVEAATALFGNAEIEVGTPAATASAVEGVSFPGSQAGNDSTNGSQ